MQALHVSFKRLRSAYGQLARDPARVAALHDAHDALIAQLRDPATRKQIDAQIRDAIRNYFGATENALRHLLAGTRRDAAFRREESIGREFEYKAPAIRRLIECAVRDLQSAKDTRRAFSRVTCTDDLVSLLQRAHDLAMIVYGASAESAARKPKRMDRRRCERCANHALAVCMLVVGNAPYQGLFPYSYSVTVGLMAYA